MRSDEIAALMVAGMNEQASHSDIGFHQGIVLAWNEATGENSIEVQGNTFTNLRVVSTSDSIMLAQGDTVGLLRFQTTYFILGRIAAPGAGASLRIRSSTVTAFETCNFSPWGNLATFGPELQNVYIGSARRCLVLLSAFVQVNSSTGYMGFQVSGASNIAPGGFSPIANRTGGTTLNGATVARTVLVSAADGLNQGFNTFTAKYGRDVTGSGTGADFQVRNITVFPF